MSGLFPNGGVPATQALNTVNVPTVSCPGGELFNSTSRCQPRFDPAAANAVMSEILNAINCGGIVYDCSRLDNLCRAMISTADAALTGCLTVSFPTAPQLENLEAILGLNVVGSCTTLTRVNNVRDQLSRLFNEFFLECITGPVPDVGATCGNIRQLVLVDNGAGCVSIASFSASAAPTARSDYQVVAPHIAPNTPNLLVPNSFNVPANYYSLLNLMTDDNNGAGILNEARIINSRLTRMTFTNDCPRRYNLSSLLTIQRDPVVQSAYDRLVRLYYRFRVNNGAWIYQRNGVTNALIQMAQFNGIAESESINFNIGSTFPAGIINLEVFYVAGQVGDPADRDPVQLRVNTFAAASGSGNPIWNLRPQI